MATTDNIAYGTSTSITCTLASLGNSSVVGRQSTPVDNTSNLYDDALLTVAVKTNSSALGSDKAVYVYLYGSEDGSNYTEDDAAIGATDAGYTVNIPSNLKGPAVINCPTSAKTYLGVWPVSAFFSGVMPRKWGIVVCNYTGQILDPTEGNHQKTYTGITYTNT